MMNKIDLQAEVDAIKSKIAKFGATAYVSTDEDGEPFVRVTLTESKDALLINERVLERDLVHTSHGWTVRPHWSARNSRYEYNNVWGLSLDAFAREYGAHPTLYKAVHDAFQRMKAQEIAL